MERAHAACEDVVPHEHHDRLRLDLMEAGRKVLATSPDEADFEEARQELVEFCTAELLPHLEHDEHWLARTAECPERRLLGLAMRAEARALRAAVYELVGASTPCDVMGATRVVHALLEAHVHHQELLVSGAAQSSGR